MRRSRVGPRKGDGHLQRGCRERCRKGVVADIGGGLPRAVRRPPLLDDRRGGGREARILRREAVPEPCGCHDWAGAEAQEHDGHDDGHGDDLRSDGPGIEHSPARTVERDLRVPGDGGHRSDNYGVSDRAVRHGVADVRQPGDGQQPRRDRLEVLDDAPRISRGVRALLVDLPATGI